MTPNIRRIEVSAKLGCSEQVAPLSPNGPHPIWGRAGEGRITAGEFLCNEARSRSSSTTRALGCLILSVASICAGGCVGKVEDEVAPRDPIGARNQTRDARDEDALVDLAVVETPLPNFVNNSFRWGALDYTVLSATLVEETIYALLGIKGRYLQVELNATNHLVEEVNSNLDWELLLADGTRFDDYTWLTLDPEESEVFSLQFAVSDAKLAGARLQPHDGELAERAPLQVPLDAPWSEPP